MASCLHCANSFMLGGVIFHASYATCPQLSYTYHQPPFHQHGSCEPSCAGSRTARASTGWCG
eukprot:4601801-Pyramimonas_sp.AAC.1